MADIGTRILTARRSRGWSQADLAKKMGVSKSTIGMWENNKREPDMDSLEALADTFNCTLAYLVETEGSPPSDHELWEMREACRKNPDTRTLFSLARDATPADIKAAIAVLESLKGARG